MKTLEQWNQIIKAYTALPSGIQFDYEESEQPVRLLREDDDTAFIVTLFFEKNKEHYKQGILIFPWESPDRVLEKFNNMVMDLDYRRRSIK